MCMSFSPVGISSRFTSFSHYTTYLRLTPRLSICSGYRGGDVGGCNGKAGSILQLNACQSPPSPYQTWSLGDDGVLRQASSSTSVSTTRSSSSSSSSSSSRNRHEQTSPGLCVVVPPRAVNEDAMDLHSVVADPMFVDAAAGDFTLKPDSPAFALGFEPIPKIEAPTKRCGGQGGCLSQFMQRQTV